MSRSVSNNLSKSVSKILLIDRAVIYCSGSDLFSFFHRMFTQDFLNFSVNYSAIDSSTINYGPVKYSLFLNPQGTCLYDFFVYKIDDEACFLDINANQAESFISTLNKYKFRSNVNFELTNKKVIAYLYRDFQHSFKDYFEESFQDFLNRDKGLQSSENNSNENKYEKSSDKCDVIGVDPRCEAMGLRGVCYCDDEGSNKEILNQLNQVDTYEENGMEIDGMEIYNIMQMLCNLPGSVDSLIPVECNMKEINAIAFGKGCYIGQEFTNRTHTSGVVRKKLSVAFILSYDKSSSKYLDSILDSSILCDESSYLKNDKLRCDVNMENIQSAAKKNELQCVYLDDKKIMNFKETIEVKGDFFSEILINSKLFSTEDSSIDFGEDSDECFTEKHKRVLNKLKQLYSFGGFASSETKISNKKKNVRVYIALGLVSIEYIDKVISVNKDDKSYFIYLYNLLL